MGTDTEKKVEDWLPDRPIAGMHFFLAGAAATRALILDSDAFPGIDRPEGDAAIEEDFKQLKIAWGRRNNPPLHVALGYPSEEEFDDFTNGPLLDDLKKWAKAHAPQIESIARHLHYRFRGHLDLPGHVTNDGVTIPGSDLERELGHSTCPLENCYVKIQGSST